MRHHSMPNGTLTFWKKVGIVCGGAIAVITLGTMIWKGASFGASWGWRLANRENIYAMNQIIDRLDAMSYRDSLYEVRLRRIEAALVKRPMR